MMKILHSADWHLDAPLRSHTPEHAYAIRQQLRQIPERVAELCRREGCRMILLSGDLFDGPCSRESLDAVRNALEEATVPVFVSPGNHDYIWEKSPYVTDLGMTGPKNSVLGIKPELSIAKFRGDLTERYRWADGPTKLEAVLFTIDTATGKCIKAERVDLSDENSSQR
jgi:hypothetical protein